MERPSGSVWAKALQTGTPLRFSAPFKPNWPKTFIYVAGWGYGHATLNGKPLYQNYEMHFLVTQGVRDRKTLKVNYPLLNKKSSAEEVNPAAQQMDFYIRSPEADQRNNPVRKVFDHFFAMEARSGIRSNDAGSACRTIGDVDRIHPPRSRWCFAGRNRIHPFAILDRCCYRGFL